MIGRMRNRVQIQKPVETADALGGSSVTWTRVADVWAAVVPRSGAASILNDQQQHVTIYDVMIRYRSDVLAKWRLLFGTRELEIDSYENVDQRDRFLRLTCLEKET